MTPVEVDGMGKVVIDEVVKVVRHVVLLSGGGDRWDVRIPLERSRWEESGNRGVHGNRGGDDVSQPL